MAIGDNYYTGSTVSRYLPTGEHSWGEAVYQSGKPVLDAELILSQEITQHLQKLLWSRALPSGWLRSQARRNFTTDDILTPLPGGGGFVPDSFLMRKLEAVVAGYPVVVEFSNTDVNEFNRVVLGTAPVFGGGPPDVKRTDFVFLEVWKKLISAAVFATGTVQVLPALPTAGDALTIGGLPLTAVAAAPAVDEFLIGGDEFTTAANIAAAINNPANSFDGFVDAVVPGGATPDTVVIRALAAGTVGNAIGFTETGVGWTILPGGGFLGGGVDVDGKADQSTIYRHGNVDSSVAVGLPDDLADPIIKVETAKRVQIQYRIRATGQAEAVNFKTEQDGFTNASVEAQGPTGAPVAGYRFVPADRSTVIGSSSAVAYDQEDAGLWIAGDGSSTAAADLETLDGYVYAIPICFVFRRNNAFASGGFSPLTNTNGAVDTAHAGFVNPEIGAIPAGVSDRPDDRFHDAIAGTDILDMRKFVSPNGVDLAAELQYQMQLLLDGSLRTWAVDTADKQDMGAGSGDVSTQYLICNEVGRAASEGGVAPISGDTTRGVTIASFDHARRRFADQPVVERVVLPILVTDDSISEPGKFVTRAGYAAAYAGWAEDDEINIDLSLLNASTDGTWADATKTFSGGSGGSVFGFAPPGTMITDIITIRHDDGNYGVLVSQRTEPKTIIGLGTDHIQITLDANPTVATGGLPAAPYRMVGDSGLDNGSPRRIFVELEITYPLGSGTTDTPDKEVTPDPLAYTFGALVENDGSTQRPPDWESLTPPTFREGKREVGLEYVANLPGSGDGSGTPVADSIVSATDLILRFPRRLFGSASTIIGVTDSFDAGPRALDVSATEYGSSSRRVELAAGVPLSGAGQTLCAITYFPQDAIVNNGGPGGGYQLSVYYRSNAPQTAGTKAGVVPLPDPLTVAPLVMGRGVGTGQAGPGAKDISYPYVNPMDQIAVNDGGSGSFPGEWYFAATAMISVDDFSAETGLLNLHAMLPLDGTADMEFTTTGRDIEFRTRYEFVDPNTYRPTVLAQPMSSVVRHKVWAPFLVRAAEDTTMWRKNEVLLVVVSRFAELDEENTVRFLDTDNRSCAAIYRTRGMLIMARE
jgi:hypothetical protein